MIRTLRRDEPIPATKPRRYVSGSGYVRLRWKVGVEEYVEEYEHRVVMGRPDGHVHHRDHDKTNNDPSNLVVLTDVEHAALHADEHRAAGLWGLPPARDRRRAAARAEREKQWAQIAAEHAAGVSTVELGRKYGRHPSNISRGLHARGYWVSARPGTAAKEAA